MISPEPEDRHGTPRWRTSRNGQAPLEVEKIHRAVGHNLVRDHFNRPDEPASQRCLATQLAPIVAEVLWLRDRVETLEKHVNVLRARATRESGKEE